MCYLCGHLSRYRTGNVENGERSHQIPLKKSCVVGRVEFWKIDGGYPEDVGVTIHSFRLRCGYVFRNFCVQLWLGVMQLQCVLRCLSLLRLYFPYLLRHVFCDRLLHTCDNASWGSVCCSVLQCIALCCGAFCNVCCSVCPQWCVCFPYRLRPVVCDRLLHTRSTANCGSVCCSVLQCVAVCCNACSSVFFRGVYIFCIFYVMCFTIACFTHAILR